VSHDQDVLASFQSGEKRLIFARPVSGGDLVMLPDGEAHAWKARTKASLRCPVADCSAPELIAVARRPRKRDGFTHHAGAGGHSAESYNHIEGKGQIARWLRNQYPDCTVAEEQSSNDQRERIADVMITNPAGERIAFEVQYADIQPHELQDRSLSYAAQGIKVVWLFGHVGVQLKAYRRNEGTVALTPTHEWMARNRIPVFWFNPFSLEVAVATSAVIADDKRLKVHAHELMGTLVVEPLDAFSLRKSGFGSDYSRQLQMNQSEADRRVEDARTREEARAKRIEQIATRRETERLRTLERARAEWRSSELRRKILTHFDGAVPTWLKAPIGGKLPVVASAWQGALFERFILGRGEDSIISVAGCTEALAGIVPAPREIRESIAAAWLVQVAKAGQITPMAACNWWAGSDRQKFVVITIERAKARNEARFTGPKSTSPVPKPIAMRMPLAPQPTDATSVIAAQTPARNAVGTPAVRRTPAQLPPFEILFRKPPAHVPRKASPHTCGICNGPLDPIFLPTGAHTICTDSRQR
jgi:hypothetical protein